MTDGGLVWILLAPLIGASVALLGKLFPGASKVARPLAAASLTAPVFILISLAGRVLRGEVIRYSLGGWPQPMGIALTMDGIAWVSAAITAVIALAVVLYSLGRERYSSEFFFFFLMMVTGMFGVAVTGDLFTMFVFFEIIAVTIYVLIAWEGTVTGLAASFKYLILSSTGILFFLLGIFLVYRETGILSISLLGEGPAGTDTAVMRLALASLCVGIGVRTAFIPFHTWLPEAHAYAPHPISAILSGAMIKVSFFAMVRVIMLFKGEYLYPMLTWIGAITALTAVVSALAQTDVKRLLAYHSISQLGYILAVFAAGSSIALTASFFHAANHALFKSLLFLTVGAAVRFSGERNLYRMGRLGREMPVFAVAFFAGALSISGIPPFNGFASKAFIVSGMEGSIAYPLLWITSFLTVASFIKLGRIYLPGAATSEIGNSEIQGLKRTPGALETISVSLLTLACVATGVFGTRTADFLNRLLYGTPLSVRPDLFSVKALLKTLPVVALGIAAYKLVLTETGQRLSQKVKAMAPPLRVVLVLFLAGLLAFAAAAY